MQKIQIEQEYNKLKPGIKNGIEVTLNHQK